MTTFPDRDLLIVGRTVTCYDDVYYVSETHKDLLEGMAAEFRDASYVCMAKEATDGPRDNGAPIDTEVITVHPNWSWKNAGPAGKLWSLRNDRRTIETMAPGTVTYCYLPGFYSFLLSPTLIRNGSVNVAHFGSSAIETANSVFRGSPVQALKRQVYRRFQQYVLHNADVALCTGPGMAEANEEAVLSRPILKFDAPSAPRTREPCESEPVELLHVGAFRPVKGQEYLIEALSRLHKDADREYRLTLVGSGQRKPRIEDLVDELGLAGVVEFTGYISDRERLEALYLKSDVFVLPSLKEAVPWVLYEATLTGLPLVATRVGGIPSFFEDGEDAVLVPSGDPSALARGIERVVDDPSLRQRLIANAQATVEDHVRGDPVEQRIDLIAESIESADGL